MTQTFFDINPKFALAFEATLREQVMQVSVHSVSWIWYFLGSLSFVSICAFVFIPYLSFSLNFLLLDVLI